MVAPIISPVSLSPGTRIGPYEVVGKLGEGGMGEVYRAIDSNLKRGVALKVLPRSLAADGDRLSRFQREAEVLAALNHPNIAAIYGLERSGGTTALAMELVEGDDLSDRIAHGPLSPAEALPIAKQIAEALEAAHELGIIHRDLKPANIKVRADGTVKVLDFGLAKALDQPGASVAGTDPTLTSPAMTAIGMILGTAAYMSPEQAKGRAVDKRADIWAFGVVLHEVLTSKRLFEGESVAETLGLIFSKEPDLAALPVGLPPALRALIARCLVKDPRQRLRDIGDGRQLLDDLIAGRSDASLAPLTAPAHATPARRPAWQWIAILGLVAIAAAVAGWFARPASSATVLRLSIALPPGEKATTVPAISPDGRLIAYAAGRTYESSQLYLRAVDDFVTRPVAGSVNAMYPFFSPNGQTLMFFAGGKLRRTSVAGGAATDIASAPTPWGGTFDADGRIVYVSGLGSGLWRVSVDGGNPEQLTKPDGAGAGYAHVFPQRLPGTRDLLFTLWGQNFYTAKLIADTGTWQEVTPPVTSSSSVSFYLSNGHLTGTDGSGTFLLSPWSPATAGHVNPATPVLSPVNWTMSVDRPWLNVSDTGTAVYVPGSPRNRHLVWIDRRGQTQQITSEVAAITQAILSNDGRRVAYGDFRNLWVQDLASGARSRIAADTRTWAGGFLPGDDAIVVSSNKGGDWDLFTVSVAGGELKPLQKKPFAQHPQAIAKDGSIIYLERQPATGSDLWTLAPNGQATPLVVTPFNDVSPDVSPDGRFVAYASDASGRSDVYVIPIGGKGAPVMASIDGGTSPMWSRDGTELFYRAGEALMSVSVNTRAGLVLGERRRLLDIAAFDIGFHHDFAASPDGKRFVFIRTEPDSQPTRLNVIVNWFEELKAKAGVK
jgi:eukaryotic-like serine/threonine-protein kinase